jgi:hypothetical protein
MIRKMTLKDGRLVIDTTRPDTHGQVLEVDGKRYAVRWVRKAPKGQKVLPGTSTVMRSRGKVMSTECVSHQSVRNWNGGQNGHK